MQVRPPRARQVPAAVLRQRVEVDHQQREAATTTGRVGLSASVFSFSPPLKHRWLSHRRRPGENTSPRRKRAGGARCASPSRCASFEYLVARRISLEYRSAVRRLVHHRISPASVAGAIPVVSLSPSFCLRRAASGGTRSARDAKRPMCRRKTRSGRGTRRAAAVSRRGRRSRGGKSRGRKRFFCSLVSRGSSSLARRAPSGSPSPPPARGRGVGTRRGRAEVEAGVAVGDTPARAEAVVSAAPAEVPAQRFSAKDEKSADRSACASRLSCRFLTSAHPTNRARREECSGLGRVAMRGRSASQGTCAAPRVGHASRSRASTDQHSSRVHSFKHLISQLWRKHSRKLEFFTSSQIKWLTG